MSQAWSYKPPLNELGFTCYWSACLYVKCRLLWSCSNHYTNCVKEYDFPGHDSLMMHWCALPFWGVCVRMCAHERAVLNVRFRVSYLISPMVTETPGYLAAKQLSNDADPKSRLVASSDKTSRCPTLYSVVVGFSGPGLYNSMLRVLLAPDSN